jgi:hypothetical protein
MEQVAGLGEVGNLHVAILMLSVKLIRAGEDTRVLVTKLKKSLNTPGRVLWALTIITVR